MHFSTAAVLAAAVSTVQAVSTGFNYGSTFTDGSFKAQADFEAEFTAAKGLAGTNSEFTSARLYTMIQGGTTNTPTSAIQAAIDTKTTLLLGLWASAGQASFDGEIAALKSAISTYGSKFTDLIVGISVGSEDLYRNSVIGIENDSGIGAQPSTLVDYIGQVRSTIQNTAASAAPVGHVDTWNDWANSSNSAVATACDFLGMDAYPYFENTKSNDVSSASDLFTTAYQATVAAAGGKPVWITETGWPVSGKTENLAVASVANAETFWKAVGCSHFGVVNTWWYILDDSLPTTPSPSFGILTSLTGTPLYDLSCSSSSSSSSSVSSSASSSATSASSASTVSATAAATSSGAAVVAGSTSAASSSVATVTAAGSASTPTTASTYHASTATFSSASASGTTAPAYTSKATSTSSMTSDSETVTTHITVRVTTTICPASCSLTSATLSSYSASTVASSSKASTTFATSVSSTKSSTSSTSTSTSAQSCPTNLSGTYQYPHLIIPVSSANPTVAYGTQYNATINSTVSSIFNFDIPSSYAGKTCSLVFLFPLTKDLETTAYTFNNQGGITVNELSTTATQLTTYNTVPSVKTANIGSIDTLTSGNGYLITSMSCPAGGAVSYEFVSKNGLALEYFEDWNPSPLGAFITVC